MQDIHARQLLTAMFERAVATAMPQQSLLDNLPDKPRGKCVVVGAGKASAAMAAELENLWPDVAMQGVVVTRYEHSVPCRKIEILEAGHPVPDDNSVIAARRILEAVQGLGPEDTVIALISGGGSALMVAPVDGVTLAEKQLLNKKLLKSGATIHEMNVVRQAFSLIKGGGLLRAAQPAKVVTLMISDVPGDDPATIASGPTVKVDNLRERAAAILKKYSIDPPVEIAEPETGADVNSDIRVIATARKALEAAAALVDENGYEPVMLGDTIEGEASETGRFMAATVQMMDRDSDATRPVAILSGGETTVTIGPEGAGRGGRNTEFLLSLAIALGDDNGRYAIACDTDGIDGTEDAAGAIITPDTLARGRALGLDAEEYLRRHDSYSYFDALGDLVRTGPTLTNVNDFRAILAN